MRHLVTGGAGFIGSNLVDKLASLGHDVVVLDNFLAGKREFLSDAMATGKVSVVEGDIRDLDAVIGALSGVDMVWHLAANPDVRSGATDTRAHFDQNIAGTYNVLEAMRKEGVSRIAFTSTSTIYGEASVIPTPEEYGPCVPISVYGATKLACEALVTSYCHTFGMSSVIFRFANCVGRRSTHGVIYDFVQKLRSNPKSLEILGDGKQNKSYFLVDDCVDAMVFCEQKSLGKPVEIFNIGSSDMITVTELAQIVVSELGLGGVHFSYTGGVDGGRGWKGDVRVMQLSVAKLKNAGFVLAHDSAEAVRECVKLLKV